MYPVLLLAVTYLSTHLIPNLFVGYDYGCSLVYVKQCLAKTGILF